MGPPRSPPFPPHRGRACAGESQRPSPRGARVNPPTWRGPHSPSRACDSCCCGVTQSCPEPNSLSPRPEGPEKEGGRSKASPLRPRRRETQLVPRDLWGPGRPTVENRQRDRVLNSPCPEPYTTGQKSPGDTATRRGQTCTGAGRPGPSRAPAGGQAAGWQTGPPSPPVAPRHPPSPRRDDPLRPARLPCLCPTSGRRRERPQQLTSKNTTPGARPGI